MKLTIITYSRELSPMFKLHHNGSHYENKNIKTTHKSGTGFGQQFDINTGCCTECRQLDTYSKTSL